MAKTNNELLIETPAYNGAVVIKTRARSTATDLLARRIMRWLEEQADDAGLSDDEKLILSNGRYFFGIVASCLKVLDVADDFPLQPNGFIGHLSDANGWQTGFDEFLEFPGDFADTLFNACKESLFAHLLAPKFAPTEDGEKKETPTADA